MLIRCELSGFFYILKKEENNGKIKVQIEECGMFIMENNRERNDKKYQNTLDQDKCGCYKYGSTLTYPCDQPGVCNKYPGCNKTIEIMSHRHICDGMPCNHIMCDRCFPETGNIRFPELSLETQPETHIETGEVFDVLGLDSEEECSSEEETPERRKFETPCGQTYWIDDRYELYTNERVEISIAWWSREDQCIYFNDAFPDSDNDSEIDDYTPPPTPPPTYEASSSGNEDVEVEGELIVWVGQSSN